MIEQCTSIVDIDIKNNTLSKKSDESSSNIYFVLFIVFLGLFIIIFNILVFYYWRKDNTKNISKKYMMLFIQIQNFKSHNF